jgi:hypothetical protein
MDAAETLPDYLSLEHTESGSGVGLAHSDYRMLASTALTISHSHDNAFMGIYRWERWTALDIWIKDSCLTILIDSPKRLLRLFAAGLDSPLPPALLFQGTTSLENWRKLKTCALAKQ